MGAAGTPDRCVRLHLLVLAVFAFIGASTVVAEGPRRAAPPASPVMENFAVIVDHNLGLAGTLALGATTLGLTSVITLAWNGLTLGAGLALLRLSWAETALLLTYAPFEFYALCLIAGGSQATGILLFNWLFLARSWKGVWRGLKLCGEGVVLLVFAAAIEAVVPRWRG